MYDSCDFQIIEEDESIFDELSEEEEEETYLYYNDMGESYYEEIYGLTYEDMFG